MTDPTFGPSPERILQLAWGYAPVLIVNSAVRLNLFDHLDGRSLSSDDLAGLTGASPRGVRALLNALVGLNLLERREEQYGLTPESSAFLVSSRAGYRGPFFHHHADQLLPQWMQLDDVVRTGRPAAVTNHEDEGADHFAGFVESLFPGNYPAAQVLGRHLDLARRKEPYWVLDIGAGSGVWGIALAEQSPQVRVRAVDFARVLAITQAVAARHGIADRLTPVAGDFFEADFGTGHDLAILGHILHSEGPERIRVLLTKVRAALGPDGVVAIQEFVPDDDRTGPSLPLLFAVNMLVNTEAGDAYTFAEISRWLQECGFGNPRKLEVPAVSPLILADRG